jgi:HEPN domain-containing protein
MGTIIQSMREEVHNWFRQAELYEEIAARRFKTAQKVLGWVRDL